MGAYGTRNRVAVVGAGWSGAAAANRLAEFGFDVEVFESSDRVGGHSRAEVLNGVVYEPNGAHIFHTSDEEVAAFVQRHGLRRRYEHRVLTEVFLSEDDERGVLLSWPPQLSELRELPLWPAIEKDLAGLPREPTGPDFASYVVSLMGPTLYRLLIRDYTVKQWGCDPSELSSRFAPKRVELRNGGSGRLFRDRWEFFPPDGMGQVIESVLASVAVTCGAPIYVDDLDGLHRTYGAIVVTAPLDEFLGKPQELIWRGIAMRSRYVPTECDDTTMTPSYVVNRPSLRVPYTRTVETKHATGQRIRGTVVSEEYPGSAERHYPVPTVDGKYELRNAELQAEIQLRAPLPVFFCGRLANYCYINQDEAIAQGFACAGEVARNLA